MRSFITYITVPWLIAGAAACNNGGKGSANGNFSGAGSKSAAPETDSAERGGVGGAAGRADAGTGMPAPKDGATPAASTPAQGQGSISPAAGVLTAGTFDDGLNFADFLTYWLDGGGAALSQLPTGGDPGRHATIRVKGPDGKPVPGARVTLIADGGDPAKPLLDTHTGGKGLVTFLTGWDGVAGGGGYAVSVTAGSAAPVTQTFKTDGDAKDLPVWDVVTADPGTPPKSLDLSIILDTTGSMGDELAYLQAEVEEIAKKVKGKYPEVDARFSVIVYRDVVDTYVTRTLPFTGDVGAFKDFVAAQSAAGGGDYPEEMEVALAEAAQKLDWRADAAKLAFLIADAPPHDDDIGAAFTAIQALRQTGVAIYPVGASGVGDMAERVMRRAALLTTGRYLFLTDDSGVGDPHAKPHIPCYYVEMLKDAMIQSVDAELTGAPADPEAGQILRTVGKPSQGTCAPQ